MIKLALRLSLATLALAMTATAVISDLSPVAVRAATPPTLTDASHCYQHNADPVHLGLGSGATAAEIREVFPNGRVQLLMGLSDDQPTFAAEDTKAQESTAQESTKLFLPVVFKRSWRYR